MNYYVLSEGEQPARLFFDEVEAKTKGKDYRDPYLDVFNEKGEKIQALKLVRDDDGKEEWTTNF